MSGQNIFTTRGRDKIASIIKDRVVKFRIGEGGYVMSSLVTEVIDAGASGTQKTYSYIILGGDFTIIGVDPTSKIFWISGDYVSKFEVGAVFRVTGSTDNDGKYTVSVATLDGGNTKIIVNETFLSWSADGTIYIDKLPICKGPTTGLFHYSLAVIEYNGAIVVQKLMDLNGVGVLTQVVGGVGGSGALNYKNGELDFTFANFVGAGHRVVTEFKYANDAKIPTAGQVKLDSQLDIEGPGGASSMYTFVKNLAPTDLVLRGSGYATLRCLMRMLEPEGLDDGFSYGGTTYYFEGGIFDDSDVMLCYFTFDKERKLGSTELRHTIDVVV